ncbi:MAG: hypothetical protein BIFFINMI_03823 [Phycisphaerae bacterium]|nr:hypothetical protein [Phycisphaerae bacterium]
MNNVASRNRGRHASISSRNRRVPSLRTHKASGQAYVVLDGQAVYLGKAENAEEIQQRYRQVLAEWQTSGNQLPVESEVITVKELLSRFWAHAEQYYRTETDGRNKELEQFKLAFGPLKELYANTRAVDFGPRAMKAVRQKMVDKGWCRPYVNKQINRIRLLFKWGVGDELIPSSVLLGLQAVAGLKRGRSEAFDHDPIRPVAMDLVDPLEPFVARQVWAIIQLQLYTAARAGELCRLRPCDVDRSRDIWVYKPLQHKTAHHGFERRIYIGPRGQEILGPFLLRDPQAYCFSPAEAEADRLRRRHEVRVTPLSCGNVPGSNRKDRCDRRISNRYTTETYRRAIRRGCEWAFPPPAPLAKAEDETDAEWRARLAPEQRAELRAWRKVHSWHPHQLRHNSATFLRKEFKLETARIILGHHSAAVTEIYAERDEQEAIAAISKVG